MEQITLDYGLFLKSVAAIIMLYKNTKIKVRSPNGNTDFFDTVTDVLPGNTLAPYLFMIRLDYVLRTSMDLKKENSFTLKTIRSRIYSVPTITTVDYADVKALLANKAAHAESMMRSLDKPAGGIGFYVNGD